MTINAILKCNGTEITEHGRKLTNSYRMEFKDVELAAGSLKRYRKPSYPRFSVSWNYLPDKSTNTADLRAGRDFIYNMVKTASLVTVMIQEERQGEWKTYDCLVSSYSENLIRNDMISQCKYFDVSLELSAI